MSDLPDEKPVYVLGVGAQKSGTTWLYDQLAKQTTFLMSPIKELHYWDRKFHPDFFKKRRPRRILGALLEKHGNKLIQTPEFERLAMDCGDEYYLAFFRSRLQPHHSAFGEISPSYSILSSDEFRHIRDFMPFLTKVIFLMRDPVRRTWSQCKMEALKAQSRGRTADPYALFANSLDDPQYVRRSDYPYTVRNLLETFETENIFFGFYESLFTAGEIDRLSRFLNQNVTAYDFGANPNRGRDIDKPRAEEWQRIRKGLAGIYNFVFETFPDQVPASWQ